VWKPYSSSLDSIPLMPNPSHLTPFEGAVSSAVERLVYTERAGGSIPSPPTMLKHSVFYDASHSLLQGNFSPPATAVEISPICNTPAKN
jgi:hypothetical protein